MKKFLGLLIFISIITPTFAVNCENVRRDLLSLENAILDSKQTACGPDNPRGEPFCCNINEKPYSCKTRRELELEYDAAVAKLVIAEGIVSLGMAIESNHNQLVRISANELAEIENYTAELEHNLGKADLLHSAISVEGGESMWADYTGSSKSEMGQYVAGLCIQGSYGNTTFCQKINANARSATPDEDLHQEYLEMLNGFFNADNRSTPTDSDRERQTRFRSYQERLTIRVDRVAENNKPGTANIDVREGAYTPTSFLTDAASPYQQVKELTRMISQYKAMRLNGEDVSTIGNQILLTANGLDPINVGYAQVATDSQTVTNFLTEQFDSALTRLDLPDLLLTHPTSENFEQTFEMLDNDYNRFKKSIDNNVMEVLEQNKGITIASQEGKSIGTICGLIFDHNCIVELCSSGACTSDELEGLSLQDFLAQSNLINDHGEIKDQLALAKSCLDNDVHKNVAAKKKCIEDIDAELKDTSPTRISSLRNEVKELDRLMSRQNNTQNFQVLNLQKQMTLDLLNSRSCSGNEVDALTINRNYCAEQNGNSDIRYGAGRNIDEAYLNLAVDGEEIAIKLNHEIFLQAMRDNEISVTEVEKLNLEEKCASNSEAIKSQSVCQYFLNRDAHLERIAAQRVNATQARERRRRYQASIPDETQVDMSGAIWSGIGTTLMQNAPRLISAGVERMQVDDWKDTTIRQINDYDEWYMGTYKPYMDDYFANPPDFSISDWGFNFTDTNYTFETATNFQSGQNNLFSNQSGTQFSFAPLPTTNGSAASSTTTNTGDRVFSFGF